MHAYMHAVLITKLPFSVTEMTYLYLHFHWVHTILISNNDL